MRRHIVFTVFLLGLMASNLTAGIRFPGVGGSLNVDQTNSSFALGTNITGFNGILKIRSAAGAGDNVLSSSGETIDFLGGTVQIGNNSAAFTGSYIPGLTTVDDEITLGNGDSLHIFEGETVPQAITVSSSSTATIGGSTLFSNGITLTDATSTINLGLLHKLGQDVTLNSGKVVLTNDLGLKDGVRLVGTGTVDLDKNTLHIGASSTAWTGTLTFNRAQDIQLNGPVSLDGIWNFATDGTDKESILNGHGNILDMSGGGTLQVGADHTLCISDLHIKGFGGAGGSFDLADNANPGTVCLSNVTIELMGNYTHGTGLIMVDADKVTVISGGQYTFTIDANATTFTTEFRVDGVALYYETLGGTNTSPFLATNGGSINTLNGGVIRSAIASVQPVDTVVDADADNGNTVSLTGPRDLRTIEKIVIANPASPTAKTVTIDANKDYWLFPDEPTGGGGEVITVGADATLTLQNVVLRNFSMAMVDLTASNSAIRFGDGVEIELANNSEVFNSSNSLVITGNTTIRGGGLLKEVQNDGIIVDAINKTLSIENLTIELVNSGSGDKTIRCLQSTAAGEGKVVLKDCRCLFEGANGVTALQFDKGSIDVEGDTFFDVGVLNAVEGEILFDWTSTGTLTVKPGATLSFGKKLNFKYNPYIPPDHTDTAATKRHLVLENAGSTLYCDGCTLQSTTTGLALDKGNLIINNEVILTASTTAAEGAELGSSLNIDIQAGSIFDMDGAVHYIQTTL